jgi:hypothetical protein
MTALGAEQPHSGPISRSARRAVRSPNGPRTPPIRVNRAPILTLWATVVAGRLGEPLGIVSWLPCRRRQ